MGIRITCPNPECGAVANVEEQSLGRRGRCKKCGQVFALARPDGEAASAMSGEASAWKGSPPAPPVASPVNLPEQFGRYRILKRLGQGGMGAVYLASDTRLNRQVALKVPFFHPADGPQAIGRFEREARAAANLDHANLCPIHDIGEVDGIHYLTMPYIEGKPLSEVLGENPGFTEAQAAAIVRKLALALQEAHASGVVHRDLKPANIMIKRGRDLVIMDFGLARMAGGDEALTRTGSILGTALYMAPEQAAGDLAATGPASDVYSLGVILYELLTGFRPFEGPWSLVIGLKNVKDPEPPSKHRPDLDAALDATCLKAIARRPEDRYPTMADFAEALGAYLAGRASPAPVAMPSGTPRPAPSPESLATQAFAGIITREVTSLREAEPPARPKPDRPGGDSPRPWTPAPMIAGGVVALLLGIAAYLATRPGRGEGVARVEVKAKPVRRADPSPARTPRISAPPAFTADSRAFGSKRFEVFPGPTTWHQARARCQELGGHLAILTSDAENGFVTGLMRGGGVNHAWIGLSDEQEEGRWRWVDGSHLGYDAWDRPRNQPNNGSHMGIPENYILMALESDGRWWDVLPNPKEFRTGFVCEWDR